MARCSFAVISDIHYFSALLTDGGRAYELRSGSDQKCLLESAAIVDAAFKKLAYDDTVEAVLIPGDLTNDGEICSHEEFSKKLTELSRHKKVFVTTATHDFCCDKNAGTYFKDKVIRLNETADIDYLRKTYAPFGPDQAIALFENFNGLCSYVVQLADGLRLFGLNDDQNGIDGSGYSQEHFDWILGQMKEAKKAGDRIIVMQHHVVVPHFTELLTRGGVCCRNYKTVAEKFAENSTDILFVGHSHWQNITRYTAKNGNCMYQVNVGALCGHPAPVFKVDINDNEIEMHTEYITQFEFNGEIFTGEYITAHTKGLIENLIRPAVNADKKEFLERLGAIGVHSKAIENSFFLIRRLLSYVDSADVGSLTKNINRFTFGRGIDKTAAEKIKDEKIIDIAYNIFLNLFDGGLNRYEKGSPVYKVTSDLFSLISTLADHIVFMPDNIKQLITEIHELVCMLMDDGENNNYKKISIKKEFLS